MEIFLHIGLHKTGTKFLQYKVFKFLKSEEINYNPIFITQLIADLIKADTEDIEYVLNHIQEELKKIKKDGHKKLLISREIMSGDCFRMYPDYSRIQKRLKLAFPKAKIIICLRNQIDWITSCYRETVNMYHYQTFNNYINSSQHDEFVKAIIWNLNFNDYLLCLKNIFGKNNVNILFYEDLKKDKIKFTNQIKSILKIKNIIIKSNHVIPNRGFSSLSILLSLIRFNFLKYIGLKFLIHRPIYMMGPKSVPAGFIDISILSKEKYWSSKFKKDYEEVRDSNYPNNLTYVNRLRLKINWRNFCKNFIDKFFYFDWEIIDKDLLKKFKEYFREHNLQLSKDHNINLPKEYFFK